MGLLVVKAGSAATTLPSLCSVRGDFDAWIAQGIGFSPEETRIVRARELEPLPDPREHDAIVITGSAAMVTDREPWIDALSAWIPTVLEARTPMLGICFGHQVIAHALGGRVDWNPRGREIGTIDISLTSAATRDPIFGDLPPPHRFHATHQQSVLELPPIAERLAHNDHDPTQAFVVRDHVWGVQFHPEFDLEVIRGYIRARCDTIRDEGLDPDAIHSSTSEAPSGRTVLARFGRFVRAFRR